MNILYRVVSWNVGALQTNPYEFHSSANLAFVKHVESKLKSFWDFKISHFVNESIINRLRVIADPVPGVDGASLLDADVSYIFSPLVGARRLLSWPDRFLRDRPTFGKYTGDSFDDDWVRFLENHKALIKPFLFAKYGDSGFLENEKTGQLFVFASHLYAWDKILHEASRDFGGSRFLTSVDDGKFDKLIQAYPGTDIFAFQEADVVEIVSRSWPDFHVYVDERAKGKQVSALLLRKERFKNTQISVVNDSAIPAEDAIVVETEDKLTGLRLVVASFHGDTNGLSTTKFLDHMSKLQLPVIVGLDANSYYEDAEGKLSFQSFQQKARSLAFAVALDGQATTHNARTFLQAQTHKASWSFDQVTEKNPKDNVLARGFVQLRCTRDNTLQGMYNERNIPDDTFPSDHAIVSCQILSTIEGEL